MEQMWRLVTRTRFFREKINFNNISAFLNYYEVSYETKVDNVSGTGYILVKNKGSLSEGTLKDFGFKCVKKRTRV